MGPIADRTKEHLGTSDKAITMMRRLLVDATIDVENGKRPLGSDAESSRAIRPHDGFVPKGAAWQDVFKDEMGAKW